MIGMLDWSQKGLASRKSCLPEADAAAVGAGADIAVAKAALSGGGDSRIRPWCDASDHVSGWPCCVMGREARLATASAGGTAV